LSDVTLSTPLNTQLLRYNGSIWVNSNETPPPTAYVAPTGEIYTISANTSTTATQNVWIGLNMTGLVLDSNNSMFASPYWAISGAGANQVLQWVGPNTMEHFHCAVSLSASTSTANEDFEFAIGYNSATTPLTGSIYGLDFAANNRRSCFAGHKVITGLNTNDTIRIIVRCITTNVSSIVTNNVNLVMMMCASFQMS